MNKYDLRRRFENETGKKYNTSIYDKKNNANTFYATWEYVEWLENLIMEGIQLYLEDRK